VIVVVVLLLCSGAVTAGVLVVNNVANRAKEAAKPFLDPTPPPAPTAQPQIPDQPGFPTELPTDLPTLPTDLPKLPGSGKKISVTYEVTGDGRAEILYTVQSGESPQRVSNAKLPWKITTSMETPALVSVTAVRNTTGSGKIGCRAKVDGAEVAQRTLDGAFGAVFCSKFVFD
jgi:hypothetical protein